MASYEDITKKIGSFMQVDDWTQALQKKGVILEGNKAINPVGGMMSGIPRSITNFKQGGNKNLGKAIKTAHQTADGAWSPAAIAGSYLGASAAFRVASGGGLTRDRNGNPDIIGLPFV